MQSRTTPNWQQLRSTRLSMRGKPPPPRSRSDPCSPRYAICLQGAQRGRGSAHRPAYTVIGSPACWGTLRARYAGRMRPLPHIQQLSHDGGQGWLLDIHCPCGHAGWIPPQPYADQVGWDITLAARQSRLRCTSCGQKGLTVRAISAPRPRGIPKNPRGAIRRHRRSVTPAPQAPVCWNLNVPNDQPSGMGSDCEYTPIDIISCHCPPEDPNPRNQYVGPTSVHVPRGCHCSQRIPQEEGRGALQRSDSASVGVLGAVFLNSSVIF